VRTRGSSQRKSGGPVMRAAIVLFVVLTALLSAVVVTLVRNAERSNAREAATQLAGGARIAAATLSAMYADLHSRTDRLATSATFHQALVERDREQLARIARAHGARISARGESFGALPPEPRFTSTAAVGSSSAVLARVTQALALDRGLVRRLEASTPLPAHAELLLVRRGTVLAGSVRAERAVARDGRVVLGPTPYAARSTMLPVGRIRVMAVAPESELTALSADYKRRTLIAAAFSLLLVAALALRFAHPLARAFGELSDQAGRDALTGLANRRLLDARLAEEIDRARRHGTHLAFVLVDVDDFKQVNDTHGHQCGDEVLRTIGAVLSSSVRELDLAGRFGGEEFALVLPGTTVDGACRVAEQIRRAFAAIELEAPSGEPVRITASFGAADFPTRGTLDELVEAADLCVYEAKRRGKDQVVALPRVAIV
jgi:diguanylate cyclase (GGDEF)-like protein